MNRPPDRSTNSARTRVNVAERAKELDFEQRARLHGIARATLSVTFLRRAFRRLWTRARPAGARPVPHPPAGTVALTFVGHATVMITTPGVRLITDPVLEHSLYGLSRARAAAIDDGDRDDVRLILISHAHRDHLSLKTLARLPREATIVVPPRCGSLVAGMDFARVVELESGETFTQADAEITAVPARHSGARGFLDRRSRGTSGYIIRAQERILYFAGDTGYFSGFLEIGRRFQPDVALLPISGYQPAPFREEHLSPLDAVYAFEDLGARILIPIAHGSFQMSYEPLEEPLAWLNELVRARKVRAGAVTVLAHGQTCLLR